MRLTDHEHQTLLQAIRAADPAAEVWLHGSRVHDGALGGDIDLLALSKPRRQRATSPSATTLRVLDSSCWLEFLADSAQDDHVVPAIEAVDTLVCRC